MSNQKIASINEEYQVEVCVRTGGATVSGHLFAVGPVSPLTL